VADLEWVLQHQERVPVGFRRNIYHALAQAYTTSSEGARRKTALERSGYPSLDPTIPLFTADSWSRPRRAFASARPRFVALAPKGLCRPGV